MRRIDAQKNTAAISHTPVRSEIHVRLGAPPEYAPRWWKKFKEDIKMSVITIKQLLEAGVHFGHHTRRWNPKMAEYIFTERNGIYIIDL